MNVQISVRFQRGQLGWFIEHSRLPADIRALLSEIVVGRSYKPLMRPATATDYPERDNLARAYGAYVVIDAGVGPRPTIEETVSMLAERLRAYHSAQHPGVT